MSRTHKDAPHRKQQRQRQISVRAVRRDPPDLHKLSRALLQMAMEEAAAEEELTESSDTSAPADEEPDGD